MNWSKGFVEWTEDNRAYLSVVFSWHLHDAYSRAVWFKSQGYEVVAGGPAVDANPDFLSDITTKGIFCYDVVARHNSQATFTSRGCPRKCRFCIVPMTEGYIQELERFPIRPIICDNNFLATSRKHFDKVIDKLKPLKGIDFNQGLDVRLLESYHVDRLAELTLPIIRLSWDNANYEKEFMRGFELLRSKGVGLRRIRVYVLIGFDDTPQDALYRLQTLKDLGLRPFPQRYQPIDTLVKNAYIGSGWTEVELLDYMHYWARLRYFEHIPFEEYKHDKTHGRRSGANR